MADRPSRAEPRVVALTRAELLAVTGQWPRSKVLTAGDLEEELAADTSALRKMKAALQAEPKTSDLADRLKVLGLHFVTGTPESLTLDEAVAALESLGY